MPRKTHRGQAGLKLQAREFKQYFSLLLNKIFEIKKLYPSRSKNCFFELDTRNGVYSQKDTIMLGLLDFFRNSISLLKLPFLTSLSQNFSTLCLHRLSKFVDKSAQKSSIFSIKASFERSLFKKSYLMIIFFGKSLQSPLLLAMRIYWGGSLASAGLGKLDFFQNCHFKKK